ncbi:SDR family oxidoreductase [Oceanobacillus oncorhynchi]|uniref:SDR family oxidoreductase n=1 Tax=Oceanobacillus oncorhynchi TaxID=545501 RepID=UPI0034D58C19
MEALKKLFSLENKVVLVAGGAQGIGKEVAEYMAAIGADIVLFDLQEEKAKITVKELEEKYGCKSKAYAVNVVEPEQIQQALLEAEKDFGHIDLLFNNAGIVKQKPVIDLEPEEWTKVIDVNLNGVFFMAQAFGKYLINRNKKGAIVNTASMSGSIVNYPQRQASYNASKAGVVQLTKSLAVEWAEHGIRVNSISPGYIFTELTSFVRKDYRDLWVSQTPMQRMGTPEEVAGGVIYLLSDSASYTTGTNLIMDGGFTSV